MLRRFLTAFALITGLAALGAPAHAVENLGERLELGTQIEVSGQAETHAPECAENTAAYQEPSASAGWPIQLRPAQVLTVYYGIDRARD